MSSRRGYSTAVNLSSVKSGAAYIVVRRLYYTLSESRIIAIKLSRVFFEIHENPSKSRTTSPESRYSSSRAFTSLTLVREIIPRRFGRDLKCKFRQSIAFPDVYGLALHETVKQTLSCKFTSLSVDFRNRFRLIIV